MNNCFKIILFASSFTVLSTDRAIAQSFVPGEFFIDTFDDGNHRDSEPAYWRRGDFPADNDDVLNGDLRIVGLRATGTASVAPSQMGDAFWSYEDVSITTQLRIQKLLNPADLTNTYAGVYGRSRDERVYFGYIRQDGVLAIGETLDRIPTAEIERLQTELNPLTHDVVLRMDFVGDLMSLTAWNPDNPMPIMPQLTYRDSTLRSGTVALLAGGSGDAEFRWVDVAPVPEPSGLLAMVTGLATLLFQVRKRQRYINPKTSNRVPAHFQREGVHLTNRRRVSLGIGVVGVISCALYFPPSAHAQLLPFLDDFNDGNSTDGIPGTWLPGASPGGLRDASSGDLMMSHTGTMSTLVDELTGLSDVSIQTQLTFTQVSGHRDGAVLFARSTAGSSYFGEITTDGILAIGAVDDGEVTIFGTRSTSLDLVDPDLDVLLRFDVVGNLVRLFAWQEGDSMPAIAQLARAHDGVTDGGQIGITLLPNITGGNSTASATFRYFSVVPEPSQLAWALPGAIGWLLLRSRNAISYTTISGIATDHENKKSVIWRSGG